MCRRSSDDDFMFASSFSNVIRITIFEHLKGFVAYYFFSEEVRSNHKCIVIFEGVPKKSDP